MISDMDSPQPTKSEGGKQTVQLFMKSIQISFLQQQLFLLKCHCPQMWIMYLLIVWRLFIDTMGMAEKSPQGTEQLIQTNSDNGEVGRKMLKYKRRHFKREFLIY